MPKPKDPNHGAAVADENPDQSPMDDREDEKNEADDQPGAEGETGAGAEEDTYD